MELLKDYAKHANECRDAAAKARNPTERDHLLQMAEHWETLARQRAAQMHLEDVLASILNPENGDHNGGTAAA